MRLGNGTGLRLRRLHGEVRAQRHLSGSITESHDYVCEGHIESWLKGQRDTDMESEQTGVSVPDALCFIYMKTSMTTEMTEEYTDIK